ncbi:hypothetical protein RhiJN_08704 [Ceratobasidium sp. AG-Ba]|nr:hypothetical protein RhiJN_08704 [Ceratobasidium sp. AG-Ba]QRW09483.1 hypothetical protein RhiLY_08482 [Ceratobasidium sp. AG-Ba]
MGWSWVIRIPARPGSHSGIRFGWMVEVRTTVVVLISALLFYQLCIKSRPGYTGSTGSLLTSQRAATICYDNLSGRAVNSVIHESRSGSFAPSDSNMSLASLRGGISSADGRSSTGEDVPLEGSDNVELRPVKRLRLEDKFAIPAQDIPAHQTTNEKSAVGVPPLDVHEVTLSTANTCSSGLLPGHTQAVSVAHKESAVPVLWDVDSKYSRTSGPPGTSPAALPGPDTSASALVLSQARGRLLLLMCEEKCEPEKIRARMLAAKRASCSTRSGSASRDLRLVIRRQHSGTMNAYQHHLVVGGQVLNLAIADALSSHQTPGFSGVPSLRGYSPGLEKIPESRRNQRERR